MAEMSIIVPTYEMGGYGFLLLDELFNDLTAQTYKDFEVIVVDESENNDILNVCERYLKQINTIYIKKINKKGITAHSVNIGLNYAESKIIKLLFMDDFFYSDLALEKIVNEFNNGAKWVMTDYNHCDHDGLQFFNEKKCFYSGELLGYHNTGNPSIHAFLNEVKVEMDENLLYIVDCDFYYRLFKNVGMPTCINETLHTLRMHRTSAAYDPRFTSLRDQEIEYCKNKYGF